MLVIRKIPLSQARYENSASPPLPAFARKIRQNALVMYANLDMIEAVLMPRNLPPWLKEKDIAELFSPTGKPKKTLSVRLSDEAHRIIEEESKRYGGLKRGPTLELLLREIREIRKRKK